MATFDEEKQDNRLEEFRKKEAEDLTKILASKYKIPYIDLSKMTIDIDSLKIVAEQEARNAGLAVFQSVGKTLQIAVKNPDFDAAKNVLNKLEKERYKIQLFLASENSLKKAWSRYKEVPEFIEAKRGVVDVAKDLLEEFFEKVSNIDGFKTLLLERALAKENRRISEVLEVILAGALGLEASDVHIEPREEKVGLRLRLDGVLHEVLFMESKVYRLLLSRIKLVSELKLNIHDKAQDGRFTIRTKETDIEVRVSVLPGPYGESVVMRVLNPKTIGLDLAALGMQPYLYQLALKELKKPNGMILVTGPTGSGKTTTLYAFVKKIITSEIKIITIEDPIEYHLEGTTQTQVEPEKGYDFSNGLKSILRQDPDVILVGEIRDLETAQTAMHAALTGHVVFSTLHTNNAAGAIPRLIDFGVKQDIIAPAINASMAQRLVRKLCQSCKKEYEPGRKEKELLETIIKGMPQNTPKPKKLAKIWKAGSCHECNNTGFKGRVGIFESFFMDETIERLIMKKPLEAEIQEAAFKQGMLSMAEDGVLKIIRGITSLQELERVVELTAPGRE